MTSGPRLRPPFWAAELDALFAQLRSSPAGLTTAAALPRLDASRPGRVRSQPWRRAVVLLVAQFKSPLTLLLLAACGLAFAARDQADATIIIIIIVVSGLLGFWQEWVAGDAVAQLLATVHTKASVLRDGIAADIAIEEVVPGDMILLKAGDAVPGDCRLVEARDLFIDEASLTGESYPVEKATGLSAVDAALGQRANAVFFGTHVVSGTAKALVVECGAGTVFGEIAHRLRLRPPETEFERGVRRLGYLLLEVTLVLVVAIFAVNVYFDRPVLEAFLFALALAVGLTPQLLPAVISVNLARGAKRMAQAKVIVKRLAAIENFGSMDVFCSDKTGTLTMGVARIHGALDPKGADSPAVFRYAYLSATLATGFANPIDEAIRKHGLPDVTGWEKLDEIPYDFVRKRVSVVVRRDGETFLVCKGALDPIVAVCSSALIGDEVGSIDPLVPEIRERAERLNGEGYRILGVAIKPLEGPPRVTKSDEASLTFVGTLVMHDPPKPGIDTVIRHLRELGISLKIITGDQRAVALHIGRAVGIAEPVVLTGSEIRNLSDEALQTRVRRVDLFAEVEPTQKERIVLSLRKGGAVVGFMGDGINDAAALHAADVGISVPSAVDVARDAADVVLLDADLDILARGVREGRTTFANTLKYVFMATSANFGNMFSMAVASLFLPFLPLLPKQILLTNLLSDVPEMTIAGDRVDPELQDRPHHWNVTFIRRFMMTFGLVSSLFDFVAFGVLIFLLRASPEQFRTGWFLESAVSAMLIVLVLRSRRPFFRSRPASTLVLATMAVGVAAVVLPYTAVGALFGFVHLGGGFLWPLALVVVSYIACAEIVKREYYRRVAL